MRTAQTVSKQLRHSRPCFYYRSGIAARTKQRRFNENRLVVKQATQNCGTHRNFTNTSGGSCIRTAAVIRKKNQTAGPRTPERTRGTNKSSVFDKLQYCNTSVSLQGSLNTKSLSRVLRLRQLETICIAAASHLSP